MERSKEVIKRTLSDAKVYLSQDTPRRISEADTKANFIEPIVAALGWEGIGVVTREYYVKDSQEFIDYVMSGPEGPILAIEAKTLGAQLTDKHAAQLIQYCAVQGIEWAALTNGRELQFFNTFLKPDLSAKRILKLDLLAFNTDAEYDALFENLWQLSRESMTTSTGVRTWLHQRRLDKELREVLLNPTSSTVKHIRRTLLTSDIKATPQEISQWFRSHLGTEAAKVPIPRDSVKADHAQPGHAGYEEPTREQSSTIGESSGDLERVLEALRGAISAEWSDIEWRETKHYWAAASAGQTFVAVKPRAGRWLVGLSLPIGTDLPDIRPNQGEFNWARITQLIDIGSEADIDSGFIKTVGIARIHAASTMRSQSRFGVRLKDLLDAGLLQSGTSLVLTAGKRDVANAIIDENGTIICNGSTYASLSDRAFAKMLSPTRTSLNGWTHWVVEDGSQRKTLADLRQEYLQGKEESNVGI